MGSKQTTTQEVSKDPWAPAQPALNKVMSTAEGLAANPDVWTPVQGKTSSNSINALGRLGSTPSFGAGTIRNVVGQTNAGMTSGMHGLMTTADGGYLKGNPYLDAVLGKSMQDAANGVNSQFSAAGRYGSGAHAGSLARELGGIETSARMDNYNTERGLQQQAQGILGQYGLTGAQLGAQVDSLDAAKIGYGLQAGALQDAQAQAVKNAQTGLTGNQYLGSVAMPMGNMGGTQISTGTVSNQPSMGAMIGGGLMSAAGLMTSPASSFMGTAGNPSLLGKLWGQ